ncbi:protein kinase GIN4 SCDLUD_003862 [Saccharomycodes ludwigii]|uniref:protein kinase GIN4 n=1 Tax=Saccharomycodes ludwigii TaxID=36035 RepID=UPI001E84C43D|nr:hypothetical protein SCDLUD_003862 [Saccharomycodes ludwigii]KAH3899582.1 hypothetical protein SCDLUD_003862 [Saccharomycodes ludwigii]
MTETNYNVPSTTADNTNNKIGPWLLGKTLGFGSSGRVRMASHERTGQQAAVKIVSKSLFNTAQNSTSTVVSDQDNGLPYGIEREIIIMKLLNYPNVLRLYDVWETENDLYMVLEYVQRGELFNLLVERGPLPEHEAIRFFRQIIIGISYCHALGIVHRDLKPENLLLDHKYNIKIADFGMAALETQDKLLETSCGSPHYAAPEIVSGIPYHGFASDVWSCGVILYALLTGRLPFDEEDGNIRKLLLKVQSGKFYMPKDISEEAQDLIGKILTVDPQARIKTREILKHPLLLKYPNIKDSKSIRNLPREDTYLNPLENGIDQSILSNLVVLWHGRDRSEISHKLREPGANLEKTFYALLFRFKQDTLKQNFNSHNNTNGNVKTSNTPSPQKIKRRSVYNSNRNSSSGASTSASTTPSPSKKLSQSISHKRLSTVSVSSSHRRPVSFHKLTSNNTTANSTSITSSSANSDSGNTTSTSSTPLKRRSFLTSTNVKRSSIISGLTPTSSGTNIKIEEDQTPLPLLPSVPDNSDHLSYTTPNRSRTSSKARASNRISISSSGNGNSTNTTSRRASRQSLILKKIKHGSITTKLIATYAKLGDIENQDWGYIENETRRTSQTFATLIDEVFEYEKFEQIRKEKEELERRVRETKLREEVERQRRERELQLENDRAKSYQQIRLEEKRKLKLMQRRKEQLEREIARLKKDFGFSDSTLSSYTNDDGSEGEDYYYLYDDNSVLVKNEEDLNDIKEEEYEDENDSTFDNDDQDTTDKIKRITQQMEQQDLLEEQNIRSISEPINNRHKRDSMQLLLNDNKNLLRKTTQKRAFSLNTRPTSRLDPGVSIFHDKDKKRRRRKSVAVAKRAAVVKEEHDVKVEGEENNYNSNGYGDESITSNGTIIVDGQLDNSNIVERRVYDSIKRSKFLGSQFSLSIFADSSDSNLSLQQQKDNSSSSSNNNIVLIDDNNNNTSGVAATNNNHGYIINSTPNKNSHTKQHTRRKSILKNVSKYDNSNDNSNDVTSDNVRIYTSSNASSSINELLFFDSSSKLPFNTQQQGPQENYSMDFKTVTTAGNSDQEYHLENGFRKISDIKVPEFTRESKKPNENSNADNIKRLSVLSLYSTKTSFRDLAVQLKKIPSTKTQDGISVKTEEDSFNSGSKDEMESFVEDNNNSIEVISVHSSIGTYDRNQDDEEPKAKREEPEIKREEEEDPEIKKEEEDKPEIKKEEEDRPAVKKEEEDEPEIKKEEEDKPEIKKEDEPEIKKEEEVLELKKEQEDPEIKKKKKKKKKKKVFTMMINFYLKRMLIQMTF